MKSVLIIRFSALGDVAILAKIMKEYELTGAKVVVLTKPGFGALFNGQNVILPKIDLKGRHKGISGLIRLKKDLEKELEIVEILDLHNTLRAKILKLLFAIKGIKSISIDKGKREKRKLTRKRNKVFKQLKTSKERYLEVLNKSGYISLQKKENSGIGDKLEKNTERKKVGVAPFAAHKQKQYPLDKMEKIIEYLSKDDIRVIIFGGGEKERNLAQKWEKKYKNVESIIGKLSLKDEIKVMGNCDLMLTMDSGNMHLAALAGTNIMTIWGATHPFAGFGGDSPNRFDIQVNMSCRPCSVFGNKKCRMGNMACMELINEDFVYKRIINTLEQM